jgi:hypothetical protein
MKKNRSRKSRGTVPLKSLQIRAKDDYMCDNKEHFHSKFTSWRPYPLLSTISEALMCTVRETREGWPLLTVETKVNGDLMGSGDSRSGLAVPVQEIFG